MWEVQRTASDVSSLASPCLKQVILFAKVYTSLPGPYLWQILLNDSLSHHESLHYSGALCIWINFIYLLAKGRFIKMANVSLAHYLKQLLLSFLGTYTESLVEGEFSQNVPTSSLQYNLVIRELILSALKGYSYTSLQKGVHSQHCLDNQESETRNPRELG